MTFIPSNTSTVSNPSTSQNGVIIHGKAEVHIEGIQIAQRSEGELEQNASILGPNGSISTGSTVKVVQLGQAKVVTQHVIKVD